MSNRSYAVWHWLLAAFLVGACLALVMTPVIAGMTAVAAPDGLLAWFEVHGLAPVALLAWDVFVVYGVSMVLPAALALALFFRRLPAHRLVLFAAFASGVLASLYLLVPIIFSAPRVSPFALPWWQHGLGASLLLAWGIALGVSGIIRMTRHSDGPRSRSAA